MEKFNKFTSDWETDFISKVKLQSKSKKQNFNFKDAVDRAENIDGFDSAMLEYFKFISSNPLRKNDYFKFLNSYKQGIELNVKYFRHDLSKLKEYYRKNDDDEKYNLFDIKKYNRYVLYMILKLRGEYKPEFDLIFNVTINESREYSPLTSIPSVLRGELPFVIKEFDIKQAYPNFIFQQLDIEPFDVYKLIDKVTFNTLLNTHSGTKGATLESVRNQLRVVYGDRVDEVMTAERFNNKSRVFSEFTKLEAEFIARFVKANNLINYVRLHDGVVTLENVECEDLNFGIVEFKMKGFAKPEIISDTINFYTDDFSTSPSLYARFLKQEGFERVTREGHDAITIVEIEGKVLSPFNHKTDLVPQLKRAINETYTDFLEDTIARDSTNKIQQALQLLDPIPLMYHKDTKTRSDIPFKNGVVRVTADSIEIISYDEIDGFFAKHDTQKHEISIINDKDNHSEFARFLIMAVTGREFDGILSDDERKTVKAFFSMFGYLLSNYKDPASATAIILSDDDADDDSRNGRRGKSLVQKALSKFRVSIEKGGIAYDPNYTHVHADLKQEHDVYLIDDVPHNFDYNALYTHITGSIDCQRKGVTAERIEFEDSPKWCISTNWAVRYDVNADSTNSRFKEYKFSRFWNIAHTPKDYFGRTFFSDWDKDEWDRFYNFGFRCIQYFLENGLETLQYDKGIDNFRALFSNDAVIDEMETIMDLMSTQTEFRVSEFLSHHTHNETFKYKPLFTTRNARRYIDTYIEFNKLPFRYSQRTRKWERYP